MTLPENGSGLQWYIKKFKTGCSIRTCKNAFAFLQNLVISFACKNCVPYREQATALLYEKYQRYFSYNLLLAYQDNNGKSAVQQMGCNGTLKN